MKQGLFLGAIVFPTAVLLLTGGLGLCGNGPDVAIAAAREPLPLQSAARPNGPQTVLDPPACGPDALGTNRVLSLGTRGGVAIGLKTYPQTLPLRDHEVVLTFDDGPDAATTPTVLDALAAECVKATFFLVGRNTQALPALARREFTAGHTIGHHTFSHPAITLRRMSPAAAEADIDRGVQADDRAIYGAAGAGPRVPFFRYPGFADTPDVNRWLAARDIATFGADLWASDWLMLTPKAELALVMERLERTKGGIVLLHDSRASTAAMLPAFLRALKTNGYKIVHVVPGPGAAETRPAPAGWSSETDRIIEAVFRREDERLHRPRAITHASLRPALERPDPGRLDQASP